MQSTTDPNHWILELFYDGECPLCDREVRMLRWMDRKQVLRFLDIAAPDFRAEEHGKSMQELMATIHARRPDGSWINGVEVFRQLYAAVGFSGLAWITRMPGISQIADYGYELFAKHRLRLTGRCAESCRTKISD